MVRKEDFGTMPDGRQVSRYILTNGQGLEVGLLDYATAINSFRVPDRSGALTDIVLGFDSLDGYLHNTWFVGAVVGRYANRIADARFSLNGSEYTLNANNGPNTLHGGPQGFFSKLWKAEPQDDSSVTFIHYSPDGEEGYPGNLLAEVTYTLTDNNELKLDYRATSDKATVINLTSHGYFNLAAESGGTIFDHELKLDADFFVPTDATSIPTGEIRPVHGTAFDFADFHRISERIGGEEEQLKLGSGYDHCWVLRKSQVGELTRAATLRESTTRRSLEVWTTEPGIQFYSGNFLDGSMAGRGGRKIQKHAALCLETQHFPDSPNRAHFPSTVLRPGGKYRSTTVFKVAAS